jgi:hypothetical protein
MSYRKAWRAVKRDFPEVHCVLMVGGFRIAKDRTREAEMEFYSLGNGYTREQAWEDAAKTQFSLLRRGCCREPIQHTWHDEGKGQVRSG